MTFMDVMRFWKRRSFKPAMAGLAAAVCLLAAVPGAFADSPAPTVRQRTLAFYNTHTDEHISVVYRREGQYVPEALAEINHFLRDHVNGEVHAIDPGLLDFLYDLVQKVGCRREVYIICGYRSVKTNTMMHNRSSGVVLGSQHTKGRAIDIRLPGIDTRKLYEAARAMKRGGTGYYKASDFIHIDTGHVRCW
jgi:uncharacterized protein YcbK (DUF882 family)